LITLVERFESTTEGEYTFIVIGYHGKPFFRILLSKIESREQVQNTNLLFVGAAFCAIGTTFNVEGYAYKRGKYRCPACGYVYDPKNGDPSRGIKPGSLSDLPFTWVCPICGTSKEQFEKVKQS
jgi:rubredoxin